MALPIWAKYMNKVYADPELGYSQDDRFTFPDGFDPCHDDSEIDSEVPAGVGLDEIFD